MVFLRSVRHGEGGSDDMQIENLIEDWCLTRLERQ